MQEYKCDICGRIISSYGIKILKDGSKICRKGICRNIFDDSRNLDEAIAMFKWGINTNKIKSSYRDGYGGKIYHWTKP